MKKLFVSALVVCLLVPAVIAAQEAEKKAPSPLQVYLADKSTENFLAAYNAYTAQMKDTMDFGALTTRAWLNYFEIEKALEELKANEGTLTNMNMFQYANILLEMGRYDEAIPLYDKLNEKSPKWSCPWRHKGTALWKKGELDKAIASLEKAIETRKTHYDAYVVLAQVYNDKKDYKKAAEVLETGLSYYGKDSEDPDKEMNTLEVQFLYLDLLKKTGQKEKFDAQHAKLMKLVPDDARLKQY